MIPNTNHLSYISSINQTKININKPNPQPHTNCHLHKHSPSKNQQNSPSHHHSITPTSPEMAQQLNYNNRRRQSLSRRGWIVPLNPENVTQTRNRITHSLLGIIADSETFEQNRVQEYVNSYWTLRGTVTVEKIGTLFTFLFENNDDKDDIIIRAPFNINGALLLLSHWTPNLCLQSFQITTMDLWIQLHGIPVEGFYEDNIRNMASTAGEVLVIDLYAAEARAMEFVRVKIRVPTNAPIIPGTFIGMPDDTILWINFRYERIFRACYLCGRIGHSIAHCRIQPEWALNGYMDRVLRTNQNNFYNFHVDIARPLFDHWVRALPNSAEFRNTAVRLHFHLFAHPQQNQHNPHHNPHHGNNDSSDNDSPSPDRNNSPPSPPSDMSISPHQALDIEPINVLPQNNSPEPITPIHHTNTFTADEIIGLIIEGGHPTGPPPPAAITVNPLPNSPNFDTPLLNDNPNSSPAFTTPNYLNIPSSPDGSDQIGQMNYEREMYERDMNEAMLLSMDESGLPNNLPLPPLDKVIQGNYHPEWAKTRDDLQKYREDLGLSWNSLWESILNKAGFPSDSDSVNGNKFYNSLSSSHVSSQIPINLSSSDTLWISAETSFPPYLCLGFVICKSVNIIMVYGIAANSLEDWNKEVEEQLKNFAKLLLKGEDKEDTHFLIFGPWHDIEDLPTQTVNFLANEWIGTNSPIDPAWIRSYPDPANTTIFRLSGLNTCVSKIGWTAPDYLPPPSVGLTILSELLLDHTTNSIGLISNWDEEIKMVTMVRSKVGNKRKRSIDCASAIRDKTRRRFQLTDGAGTSRMGDLGDEINPRKQHQNMGKEGADLVSIDEEEESEDTEEEEEATEEDSNQEDTAEFWHSSEDEEEADDEEEISDEDSHDSCSPGLV